MSAPQLRPFNGSDGGPETTRALVFCEAAVTPLVIPAAAMEQIVAQVQDGFRSVPKVGAEVGGLLAGPKAANGIVAERAIPLATDYHFGPALHLSDGDREKLAESMRWEQGDPAQRVVGYYRSRNRTPGPVTRDSDREILAEIERAHLSYAVDFLYFLIFTPVSRSLMDVAAAIRKDGMWEEWAHYQLRLPALSLLPGKATGEYEEAPGRPANVAAIRSTGALPPPTSTGPMPQTSPGAVAPVASRRGAYVVAALVILGIGAGASFWLKSPRPSPAPAAAPSTPARPSRTGFAAAPEGGLWRLTWNAEAMTALHPEGAVLSIRDGENEQQIALAAADLATGTVYYTPQNRNLVFSLKVIVPGSAAVEEHVRVLAAVAPPPRPADAAVRIVAKDEAPRILRPFTGVPTSTSSPRPTAGATALDIPAPPALPATAGPLPAGLPMQASIPAAPARRPETVSASLPQTLAISSAAPAAPPSAAPAASSYAGPKPLRQMKASGVADVVLQSPVTVQVRVAIDDSGKVTKVTPLSTATNNFRLVDSAVHAARFWTFAPAQLNGRPVTSEMILEFRFGR